MKVKYWAFIFVFVFCACALGIRFFANATQPPEERRLEAYAEKKYAKMNKESEEQLGELFNDFSSITHARQFMRNEHTKELYKQFLISVFEDAKEGNIAEAIFQAFILEITPTDIILDATVPELSPDGKLHGILDLEDAAINKRLQHQPSQGYPGEPDFRHYASYLSQNKDVNSSPHLISYMFKTAPGKALQVMVSVDYSLPYPPNRLSNKNPSALTKIRAVLLSEHIISNVIWHEEFRFDIRREQRVQAKDNLTFLSKHKIWWVRLYVAEIMQKHPSLLVEDVVKRLKADENDFVREAMARLLEKPVGLPTAPRMAPARDSAGK